MESFQCNIHIRITTSNSRKMGSWDVLGNFERPRPRIYGQCSRVGGRTVSLGISRSSNRSGHHSWTGPCAVRSRSHKVCNPRHLIRHTNIKTRLIVTPIATPSRSLTQSVRYLPSYIIPSKLFLPTIFHEIITPTIHHTTPLFLRSHLSLDPLLTPGTYSLAKFFSRTAELFIKLPFETVLRRAQVDVLASPEYATQADDGTLTEFEAMVPMGEYRGVFATMWCIAREEGVREEITVAKKGKKGKVTRTNGQGVEGLWRGWRVGMWGLVGVWGSGLMGGNANGGEF